MTNENAIKQLKRMKMDKSHTGDECNAIMTAIKALEQEPKTGHWIALDKCSNSGYYCSECHKKVVKEGWSETVKRIKFCPNCGMPLEGIEHR